MIHFQHFANLKSHSCGLAKVPQFQPIEISLHVSAALVQL